jgi:hypothetical protein
MNDVYGSVKLALLKGTDLSEESFYETFQKENIIAAEFKLTLSNGSVHTFEVSEVLKMLWDQFDEGETDEKKDTKLQLSDKKTI